LQVKLCDPCLSALEVVMTTHSDKVEDCRLTTVHLLCVCD